MATARTIGSMNSTQLLQQMVMEELYGGDSDEEESVHSTSSRANPEHLLRQMVASNLSSIRGHQSSRSSISERRQMRRFREQESSNTGIKEVALGAMGLAGKVAGMESLGPIGGGLMVATAAIDAAQKIQVAKSVAETRKTQADAQLKAARERTEQIKIEADTTYHKQVQKTNRVVAKIEGKIEVTQIQSRNQRALALIVTKSQERVAQIHIPGSRVDIPVKSWVQEGMLIELYFNPNSPLKFYLDITSTDGVICKVSEQDIKGLEGFKGDRALLEDGLENSFVTLNKTSEGSYTVRISQKGRGGAFEDPTEVVALVIGACFITAAAVKACYYVSKVNRDCDAKKAEADERLRQAKIRLSAAIGTPLGGSPVPAEMSAKKAAAQAAQNRAAALNRST